MKSNNILTPCNNPKVKKPRSPEAQKPRSPEAQKPRRKMIQIMFCQGKIASSMETISIY